MRDVNLSRWAVEHQTLVGFMAVLLMLAGGLCYWFIGRAEEPAFTIKVAAITVVWPGASAYEMQTQVADPIEKKLQEIPYFEKAVTYSKPSFTAIQFTLKDSIPPRLVPWHFYLIRKKLADVRPQLPADVIGPTINDEYGDVDAVLYTLTMDGDDFASMKRLAEDARQRLLRIPEVSRVNIYGVQDRKIFVETSKTRLATLGVSPQSIFDGLQRQNAVVGSGVVETRAFRMPLRVAGAFDGVAAVRDAPIEAGGKTLRLGDVASVRAGYKDPPDFLVRAAGRPALALGVVMATGGNIQRMGAAVDAAMEEVARSLPANARFSKIADQPAVVTNAIKQFMTAFVEALVIVLFVSFLSLGWRTGVVVAFSVPVVLAIVFILLYVIGIDLQRISLGALIIALGLLVDDAMIAVEMMVVKMEEGVDRLKAAVHAWDATAFPMLTGTLVTAAGFLPVGFAASSTGEYAGSLFWVVMISLVASWFVAVIFTPWLGVRLLPDFAALAREGLAHAPLYDRPAYKVLRSVISWCVSNRWLVVATTLVAFLTAGAAFALRVQQQFFPISERAELFFEIRMPQGSSIGSTLEAVKKAEGLVAQDPDILSATAYIGEGSPRFWFALDQQLPNEAFGELVLVNRDVPARERVKARLEKAVRDGLMPEARVRVVRFNFGPPVGFPVQFRVIGSSTKTVREIAARVRDTLRQDPAIVDPHLDWNEQTPSLRLDIDQQRMRALGLTSQDVSQSLQTQISGLPVTTVRDGIDKVDVVVRASSDERLDPARIDELTMTTRNGAALPLSQVARLGFAHEEAILFRRNRDMAITVRADVVDGVQAPDVTSRLWPKLEPIIATLPQGYRIEAGGAAEEAVKANLSIAAVFPVMLFIMVALLMIQLQNVAQLFLVLMSAPLGLIGASLALNISGAPFGFVALLGLIALSGMDMRNSLILVDRVHQGLAEGASYREAIVESAVRRARPVGLTALAAILAMIPLSHSAFWGPMAITMMGGLFVATFLTLFFLPALYAVWFRKRLDTRLPK